MVPNIQTLTQRAAAIAVALAAALSVAGAQTYTITAKSNAGGSIAPSGKVQVPAGGSQTFTIAPNTGFSIVGVVVNKVAVGPVTSYTFDNVQANGSIKATFKIQSFTVTFSAVGAVKITPSGSKTLKYGKKTTVTVSPQGGTTATPVLTVDGAPVTLTKTGKVYKYTLTVTGPHVLVASLAPQHTVAVTKTGAGAGTVSSAPPGISCGATCSHGFDEGSLVTLSAAAASGSTFTGWSGGGCSGTGDCQIAVTADTSVTADFTLTSPTKKTLSVTKSGSGSGTVTSSPAGIDCGGTCSGQYDQGTDVTLSAAADSGSTFTGWSGGGCSGTGTCKVTLNADTAVTATFTKPAGTGLTAQVTDSCGAAAVGAILAVHNANGTVKQTFTIGASGTVDLGSFGSPVTFTVGWPNSMNIADAGIQSFVEVPGNLGTFHVQVEGGTCPPSNPQLGSITVDLNPAPALFGSVQPLGTWIATIKTFNIFQSNLQTDGKLTLLGSDGSGLSAATKYGFLLDQTFTNGATYTIDLNKTPSSVNFSAGDNIQSISVNGQRKGQAYNLGQALLQTPTTSGQVPVFDQFPAANFAATATAPFLFDNFGLPYSLTTWNRVLASAPSSLTIPALFHITDLTFDSNAVLVTWTLSDSAAGKVALVGFSNVQSTPTVDDRHWTVVLDPTTHSSWAESNLTLPSELDLTGRTPQGPSMAAYEWSYVHTYADGLRSVYAGGVTPPSPPYDLVITSRLTP